MSKASKMSKMSTISIDWFNNTYQDFSTDQPDTLYMEGNKLKPNQAFKRYQATIWEQSFKKFRREDDYSVYTGSCGVALLKLLLSTKALTEKDEKLLLEEAKNCIPTHRIIKGRISFLCGDAGPYAINAVIAHKLGDFEQSRTMIDLLINLGTDILEKKTNVPNELLYGRAGYIFALLFVKKHIAENVIDDEIIRKLIKLMLKIGAKEATDENLDAPLIYKWHDRYYLGAAHGLSGILYIMLLAQRYIDDHDLNNLIRPSIDFLVGIRFANGNFPSSLGKDRDRLVQWCHGAPGFTHLFCLAYKVFKDIRYLNVAIECGEVVWKRGLTMKGYSLCHGVAGNAYTFLRLFKTTGDEKYLYRACKFAEWITDYNPEHEKHTPDRPLSLFEGLAGRLYFITDLQDPLNAKFPGFEL